MADTTSKYVKQYVESETIMWIFAFV